MFNDFRYELAAQVSGNFLMGADELPRVKVSGPGQQNCQVGLGLVTLVKVRLGWVWFD